MRREITTIAYHLGQFRPNDINNKAWGRGFTEWHNVAKARSLFPGHVQPVLPACQGFYDLRCDSSIIAQMDFAKSISIDAFCCWHYWFNGFRILHEPLERMMELPDNGLKFMLGWANESWSGIWHGSPKKILLQQSYNLNELEAHSVLISKYVNSGRYLMFGQTVPFLIYRPRLIPECKHYLDAMRIKIERRTGLRMYIIGNWGPGNNEMIMSPHEYGLDAVVATPVGKWFNSRRIKNIYHGGVKILKSLGIGPEIRPYTDTIKTLRAAHENVGGIVHSTVVTGWDNTPRSERRGLVLANFNESTFKKAIHTALSFEKNNDLKLLFVKSFNEWAEGNTIEPVFQEKWSTGETFNCVVNDVE